MHLRRVALWSLLGVLLLLSVALAWLWTADLGVFKPQLERLVSDKTGRALTIGGLEIDLARHTILVAEDVTFANPEWAEDPDMVSVGRLEARVDFFSLLRGPFIVELIDVDDATVKLTRREDGEPNWALPVERPQKPEQPKSGLDLLIRQIEIDGSRVVYESPERTRPLDLRLQSIRQQHRPDDLLVVSIDASLNEREVGFEGSVGTWQALLARKDVRFDFDASLDTFELTGEGRIDDLLRPAQPEFAFTAAGPDVNDLLRLLGLGAGGTGDINLSGSLGPGPDERLWLNVDGNVGATEIRAKAAASDLQHLRNLDIDLVASSPDLSRILRMAGVRQFGEAPFTMRIDAETEGSKFRVKEARLTFADATLDLQGSMPHFPSIDDTVMQLTLKGPDIARFRHLTGLPGAAEGAFSIAASMNVDEQGVEELELDLETSLAELHSRGRLGEAPDFYASRFEVEARTDSLERLGQAYGLPGLPDRPMRISGAGEYVEGGIRTLTPIVSTVGDVAAKLSGRLGFKQGAVDSDAAFELTGPDLAELVGAFVDVDMIPAEPYDVNGQVNVGTDGYRFQRITGSVGSSDVNVDGLLTTRTRLAGSWLTFGLEGPELTELIEGIGDYEVRPGWYRASGEVQLEANVLALNGMSLDRGFGNLALDATIGLPTSRNLLDFDLSGEGADIRSLISSVGSFEAYELPYSIEAQGARDGDSWTFDNFSTTVGDATAQVNGILEFSEDIASTNFLMNVNIPSLARLGTIDGRRMNDQGIALVARATGTKDGLEFDQLEAKLGDSDVRGYLKLEAGDVPTLDFNVVSDSVVVARLLEPEEYTYDPEPEFVDGRLVPDVPLPLDAMRKLNASVDVDIGRLKVGKLELGNVEVDASLRDGALDISNAGFTAKSGAIRAVANVEPVDNGASVSLEVVARDFAMGVSEMNQDLAMTGDLDVKLESTGADVRTLLGNADGVVFVNTRGGRMANNPVMQALYGDLLEEILSTINPFRETDPYMEFDCAVVPVTIDDGKLASAPAWFIRTNRIMIAASPRVDLKTEDVRVAIRTTPRRALSVSAAELVNPYVQVVGTLAAPRLAVDEAGVLITGGAAVATGGLTLLARGVWDRLSRSRKPCRQASTRAVKELGDRFPDLAIEGTQRLE